MPDLAEYADAFREDGYIVLEDLPANRLTIWTEKGARWATLETLEVFGLASAVGRFRGFVAGPPTAAQVAEWKADARYALRRALEEALPE